MVSVLLMIAIASDPAAAASSDPGSAPAAPAAAAAAATPAAASVLVLHSGHRLVVRSWIRDGRVLRIVDEKGAPVLLKTELVDFEQSEAATRQHGEQLVKAENDRLAEQERAAAAAELKVQQQEKIESQRAQRKSRGTMNTAPDLPPGSGSAPAGGAGAVAPSAATAAPPGGAPDAAAIPDRVKRELNELLARRRKLASEYNALVDTLNHDPMADYDSGRLKLDAMRREMSSIDARLDEIRAKARGR